MRKMTEIGSTEGRRKEKKKKTERNLVLEDMYSFLFFRRGTPLQQEVVRKGGMRLGGVCDNAVGERKWNE